ncbi:MAG: Ig-like domain-containing protein, partial [Gammaproteobacteria bacterium]
VPGNQNVAEDASLVFSSGTGNAITVDDGTTGNPELRTTLSVTNGTLTLATMAGITIDSGANGTADMTIHGTESAINAALDGLTYTPTGDYNGPANLQVTTDLDAHLLGNYSFDTASPGTNDSDPGTNDGIVIGDPVTVFDATRNGDVLVLDGNDSIQIPGRFGKPADVTLAAWVNLDASRTNDELISIGNSVALRLDDTNLGDGVTGFFWDGVAWRHTSSSLNISGSGWHHVAYTFDDAANEQTIYIDGVALMTTNNTASIVYNRAPDTSLGSHASGSPYFLSGMLDDARIYERALTAGEIAALASDLGSDTSAVDITVDPVNDAPVAGDLTVNALEDGLTVTGSFVATDVEGTDTHTFDITGTPAEGSVANNGNGTFSFNPGSDFQDLAFGETRDVTFTYTATDDSGALNDTSTAATVTITVTGSNDTPTLSDYAVTLTEDDGSKDFSFLVNDIDDTDKHTFTITSTLGAGSGTLENRNDGKFRFTPGSDFHDLAFGETRDVSFTYTATDDSGTTNATSSSATVTISVTGDNDRPVVSDVAISAIEDGVTVTGSFVVDDVDDTDLHTFDITSAPAEGSVVNNGNGTFTFDPGADFQDLAEGETR